MKNLHFFLFRIFSLRSLTLSATFVLAFFGLSAFSHAQLTADEWQPGQINTHIKQTNPHDEVQKALKQAKYPLALRIVEQSLSQNPLDPQMRFWKAFIFEQQNRVDDAFAIYQDLTQDYPELPEPQNNLGVIYARRGDYDNAQAAFEAALRSNPNYSTAEENLADMLVHRAQLFYKRAISHATGSAPSATQKLKLLQPVLSITEAK